MITFGEGVGLIVGFCILASILCAWLSTTYTCPHCHKDGAVFVWNLSSSVRVKTAKLKPVDYNHAAVVYEEKGRYTGPCERCNKVINVATAKVYNETLGKARPAWICQACDGKGKAKIQRYSSCGMKKGHVKMPCMACQGEPIKLLQ